MACPEHPLQKIFFKKTCSSIGVLGNAKNKKNSYNPPPQKNMLQYRGTGKCSTKKQVKNAKNKKLPGAQKVEIQNS